MQYSDIQRIVIVYGTKDRINTFLESNPKISLQTPVFDYNGNQIAMLQLEEPPVKWATLPPPQTSHQNIVKKGPTDVELKKSFDSVNPPWIPLGYLLIAIVLGFVALLILVTTAKELFLTIGNTIKRRYYLNQNKPKTPAPNKEHEIEFSLNEENKTNISEQELEEFTSSLMDNPDATPPA